MPTEIGHHDVKDKDHSLASPKRVLMDVADMDALKAAMETPGAAEAMAYDGVVPETLVMLVEA
jgi:hypothetical protein